MSSSPKLHPDGVLNVVQREVYALAKHRLDYVESSPTKAATVARGMGLYLSVEQGGITVGDPATHTYGWLEGRDYTFESLPGVFRDLVAKVQAQAAELTIPLDIRLAPVVDDHGVENPGVLSIASHGMRFEMAVDRAAAGAMITDLCHEYADIALAEGEVAVVRIVPEISDLSLLPGHGQAAAGERIAEQLARYQWLLQRMTSKDVEIFAGRPPVVDAWEDVSDDVEGRIDAAMAKTPTAKAKTPGL